MSAIIAKLDIPQAEKNEMKKWVKQSEGRPLKILITGRTGVGKSTLVNGIVGSEIAEEGSDLKAKTMNVQRYESRTEEGMVIEVWDSPGLEDGSGNEEQYLAEMKENCCDVDIVIYCMKLDTREQLGETQHDYLAIRKLTETFWPIWWDNSIFVMTHANAFEAELEARCTDEKMVEEEFKSKMRSWKEEIRNALLRVGVSESIANKVPVKPAGHSSQPHLPGQKYWFSALWHKILKRTKQRSQANLLKLGANRFKNSADIKDGDFATTHRQPIVVDFVQTGSYHGAGIGADTGAVGGAPRSVAGYLVYLWRKHISKRNTKLDLRSKKYEVHVESAM